MAKVDDMYFAFQMLASIPQGMLRLGRLQRSHAGDLALPRLYQHAQLGRGIVFGPALGALANSCLP